MLTLFLRTVVLYSVLFLLVRLMGKRQLRELEPFEFVITLIIANLTITPMSDTGVPLIYGLVPILGLFLMQQLVSFVCLKSQRVRSFLSGKPNILIMHGNICENEMRTLRYTLSDLTEQLRSKDIPCVSDVEFAILETNGELSVILKSTCRPVTPEDLSIPVPKAVLPLLLVMDGRLQQDSLVLAGRDESWLREKLRALGFPDAKKVFYACLNGNSLVVQGKGEGGMRTLSLAGEEA